MSEPTGGDSAGEGRVRHLHRLVGIPASLRRCSSLWPLACRCRHWAWVAHQQQIHSASLSVLFWPLLLCCGLENPLLRHMASHGRQSTEASDPVQPSQRTVPWHLPRTCPLLFSTVGCSISTALLLEKYGSFPRSVVAPDIFAEKGVGGRGGTA